MRIRVIFAKFQDDNDNVSYWPQAGFPSSALSFIDSTASQNSTHKLNLTNYYRTFSDGQYILTGKVDTVTLNQSMLNSLYMGTSGTYQIKTYNANKAILNSLSGRPGFELYDDWTRIDNNHSKCPDSIPRADMSISEQNGDLVAARSYLNQASELQRSVGHQEEMVEAYASMMEGIFATRPEQQFLNGSGMSEQSPFKSTEDPKDEPVLTVFPNPFNPETVVTIELRSEQRVRIEVYNTLGQRVLTLVDGQLTTGRQSVRMDGSNLASGVYLIRVHTGQQVMTHRVTLIK